MSLYTNNFISILIITIVKNSIADADIPNCDYFDTVDISDLKRVNDTYFYIGIEISANQTGEYNNRKLTDKNQTKEAVKNLLRACVCELKTCVRICSPRKNMLANGKCNYGFSEENSLRMLNLSLYEARNLYPTIKELKMAPLSNFTELLVIRDQFQMYDKVVSLREDEYRILKDGNLIVLSTKEVWPKERYCLHPQFNTDFPISIWIFEYICMKYSLPGHIEIKMISVICLILILFVYVYVKKLRNVLGNCLICGIFSCFMNDLLYLLETWSLLNRMCLLAGYSRYFFVMAFNFWFFVISFHLWELLTNRNKPSSFVAYSAFAWSMAAFSTGITYVINLVWEKNLRKWYGLPLVGNSGCSLKAWGPSHWIYFGAIVLILTIFEIILFILTVTYIWKVKSELRKFKQAEERTIQCFYFDTDSYLIFLRLSVIMGAAWIFVFFIFLPSYSIFKHVWFFVAYMEHSFGIIVFMLLIVKRSTLKMLMERIRGRR